MDLIRYELLLEGKYAGCGIFHGRDSVCNEQTANRYLKMFGNLPMPPADVYTGKSTLSWFTPKGVAKFKEPLRKITLLYEKTGILDVVCRIGSTETCGPILYQDEFQVISQETESGFSYQEDYNNG